jgi:hypothetical protein
MIAEEPSRLRAFVDNLLQLDGEGAKHPCRHGLIIVVPV